MNQAFAKDIIQGLINEGIQIHNCPPHYFNDQKFQSWRCSVLNFYSALGITKEALTQGFIFGYSGFGAPLFIMNDLMVALNQLIILRCLPILDNVVMGIQTPLNISPRIPTTGDIARRPLIDADVINNALEKRHPKESNNNCTGGVGMGTHVEKIIVNAPPQTINLHDNIIDEGSMYESSSSPLVFLSHCSKDKKYGDAIQEFLTGLGLESNQLIYTSHPRHKIPLDENISDFLRKNITRKIFMIILWSDNYLESPACLNEMGAAWAQQSDYTNIFVSSSVFSNPKYHQCAVDTGKMGILLNGNDHCKANMIELKDKIARLFKLKVTEQNLTYLLDRFVKSIL